VAYPLTITHLDGSVAHYQLFMRSAFGAYSFLGTMLHERLKYPDLDIAAFKQDDDGYAGLLEVKVGKESLMDSSSDCFAAVSYRGMAYCVPQGASRTKRTFTLLHQLQQLSTAPANTPTTLTVTGLN
jgi:hypothetical protein